MGQCRDRHEEIRGTGIVRDDAEVKRRDKVSMKEIQALRSNQVHLS